MNEHIDPMAAAQRAVEAMEAAAAREATAAPPTRDLEAELRALVEADEAARNATYADAWTCVARARARKGGDPTIFRPQAARTAIAIGRLLVDLTRDDDEPDQAFVPLSEAEAKSELERTRRTAGAIKAIAALARA